MDDGLKEIDHYLHEQGLAWAKEFIAGRKAWPEKRGIRASGTLLSSLQQEVTERLEGAARVQIDILFSERGRYIDLKRQRVPAGGGEYIAALEKWIEEKGLRERFTQRYLRSRKVRRAPDTLLNQLAWAVAKSRHERYLRRSAWYNKAKAASVTDLFNKVAAGLPEKVAREIQNAFFLKT